MLVAQVKRTSPPRPLCVLFTANGRQPQPGCTVACTRPVRPLSLRSSGRREAARGCDVEDVPIRVVNDCRRAQWTRRACSLIISTHDSSRPTHIGRPRNVDDTFGALQNPARPCYCFQQCFQVHIPQVAPQPFYILSILHSYFLLHCGLGLVLVCIGMYLVTVCACHIEIKRYLLTYLLGFMTKHLTFYAMLGYIGGEFYSVPSSITVVIDYTLVTQLHPVYAIQPVVKPV